MPRGDGTGPGGMGPMTGRGAGFCAGYDRPGFLNPIGGRLGGGFGWARGGLPVNYGGWGGYQPQYGGGYIPQYTPFRTGMYSNVGFGGRGWGRGRGGIRGPRW